MSEFLTSNDARYRLARTILQGLIGVLCANLDLIFGYVVMDPTQRAIVVAATMAVLSPIMAMLGDQQIKNGVSK